MRVVRFLILVMGMAAMVAGCAQQPVAYLVYPPGAGLHPAAGIDHVVYGTGGAYVPPRPAVAYGQAPSQISSQIPNQVPGQVPGQVLSQAPSQAPYPAPYPAAYPPPGPPMMPAPPAVAPAAPAVAVAPAPALAAPVAAPSAMAGPRVVATSAPPAAARAG